MTSCCGLMQAARCTFLGNRGCSGQGGTEGSPWWRVAPAVALLTHTVPVVLLFHSSRLRTRAAEAKAAAAGGEGLRALAPPPAGAAEAGGGPETPSGAAGGPPLKRRKSCEILGGGLPCTYSAVLGS